VTPQCNDLGEPRACSALSGPVRPPVQTGRQPDSRNCYKDSASSHDFAISINCLRTRVLGSGRQNWVKIMQSRLSAIAIFNNLGRCPTCVRQSARAMLCSYLACAAASWLSSSWIITGGLTALSILLTCLWIAHLLAYASRSSRAEYASPSNGARRAVLRRFVRNFAAVAVATAVPAITQTGWAQGVAKTVNCKNGSGSCGPCPQGQNCNCWCDIVGDVKCNPCA
jgi:hypothetical protein